MQPASRDQALAAVRAFHAEHGRLPRWCEWESATESRPCAKTIERRWGWRELLAEAVGTQPKQSQDTRGEREGGDVALLAALDAAPLDCLSACQTTWPRAPATGRVGPSGCAGALDRRSRTIM
jgi:hypothetical protein